MPSLNDVARAAGVSESVASRTLNDDPTLRARPETRARVHEAARRLGYTPNHAARALRLARAATIALVLPDVGNPLVAETLRGAEDGANERQLSVLLGRSERLDEDADLRRIAAVGRVDGFLVQLTDTTDVAAFERAAAVPTADSRGWSTPAPVVLLHAHGRHMASVSLDDEGGVRFATQHLIDLGHTDIGWIGGLRGSQSAQRRARGFSAALSKAGLVRRRRWVTARGYRPDDGRAAVEDMVAAGPLPTGVVVANVNAAFGVLQRLGELGIAVPERLSVIAYHDSPFADFLAPRLTTVRMPLYEMARTAVQLLADQDGDSARGHVVISDPPPTLVLRESTCRVG